MRSWSKRSRRDTARRFMFTVTKRRSSTSWRVSSRSPSASRKAAPTGAMVVGPRNIPHTFRNIGSQDGHLLLTVIPGRFANYFIEVDGMDDGDLAKIKALLDKYEVEL